MRFLLDECLSSHLVDLLADAGHDAAHLSARGLLGATDEVVMRAAATDVRVLVSADTHFGELLASSRTEHRSLILLRQGNRTAEHQAATLLANLAALTEDLEAGAIIVITDDRIQVRRLPVG